MPSHPLRTRSFALLFAGQTLSLAGDAAVPVALTLAVYRATGSSGALALVLTCALVPKVLLLPLGGVIGDRFDPRTVALVTNAVRAAGQIFVGLQLLGGHPHLWQIAAAEAVGGVAGAFSLPTAAPLVRGTVDDSQLLRANALMASVNGAVRLGGPALGGTLVLTVGAGWAFLLDGASFAACAALLAAIRVRRVRILHSPVLADLKEGWSEVRARDWYWSTLIAHGVWNGAAAVLATLGPAMTVGTHGDGEGTWVTLMQVGSAGVLAGSLLAGRARPRRPVLVSTLGLSTYALPLALLAASAPAWATAAAYGLALTGLGYLGPVWDTSVMSAVPEKTLARVTSYDWLISIAAMPLGYVLAPLAASAVGPGLPLGVAAAAVLVSCLATAALPGVRHFETAPGPGAPRAPEVAPTQTRTSS
ncbi:MFS transporter [Streptomyces sp. NBC_00102]|uniref:MFS transporter n=1 Tax=Streptomyces sp. NBC_00102 TaxID=2975652 RepID=UPI0022554490|nr:MFS transporter [Streptomyces sp. NBC_00102]MCX5399280.1 MFS transporter [Streptomyces sp. NBC_00102]